MNVNISLSIRPELGYVIFVAVLSTLLLVFMANWVEEARTIYRVKVRRVANLFI